ncbi:UPF0146 family protein [Natronomonas sp. EA1]|uniref:UPF0146 family protein n=1 Tax=Natronomonas sp. EA1 TaxID=3421655 RepID=UPI003EB787DF
MNSTGLVDRLARYDRVVEVGVGNRPDVAGGLAERGVDVLATDLSPRAVPEGVAFVVDDITDPDIARYEGADAVFARNLPPELHRPVLEVARRVGAVFHFTTLGGDPASVPVTPETLPDETLFTATVTRGE